MKSVYSIFLLMLCMISTNIFASHRTSEENSVPTGHKFHCRKWVNNKCHSGAVTDLAASAQIDSLSFMNSQSEKLQCDKVCEKCSSCNKCSACLMCDFYHDDRCKNVPYYNDDCSISYTKTCCDVCKNQCDKGACSKTGICSGSASRENSIIMRCSDCPSCHG